MDNQLKYARKAADTRTEAWEDMGSKRDGSETRTPFQIRLEQYFQGKLSPQERRDFERAVASNEGLSSRFQKARLSRDPRARIRALRTSRRYLDPLSLLAAAVWRNVKGKAAWIRMRASRGDRCQGATHIRFTELLQRHFAGTLDKDEALLFEKALRDHEDLRHQFDIASSARGAPGQTADREIRAPTIEELAQVTWLRRTAWALRHPILHVKAQRSIGHIPFPELFERYLAGRLTRSQRRAFEALVSANPDLKRLLELALANRKHEVRRRRRQQREALLALIGSLAPVPLLRRNAAVKLCALILVLVAGTPLLFFAVNPLAVPESADPDVEPFAVTLGILLPDEQKKCSIPGPAAEPGSLRVALAEALRLRISPGMAGSTSEGDRLERLLSSACAPHSRTATEKKVREG